jgi:radical SAM/Cys-rich protein
MGRDIIEAILLILDNHDIGTIDLTGGAPELNPSFRFFVQQAALLQHNIIVRSNLTIFFEKGMEDLPEFYSDNNVSIIASLPHYVQESVDRMRGDSTFSRSIKALRMLNELGYGLDGERKQIHLVYNPMGAFLPPPQRELEDQYKHELSTRYGIVFNRLYTFANMPIGRFKDFLLRTNNYERYMETVKSAFNCSTLDGLMCRHLISIGWDGRLYDCDFNQILGIGVDIECPQDVREFSYLQMAERKITTGNHCFVCTAGQGST